MNFLKESYNLLVRRATKLGQAIFGKDYTINVIEGLSDKQHSDPCIGLSNHIEICIECDLDGLPRGYYWGVVSYTSGNSYQPPDWDFDQLGSANLGRSNLDAALIKAFAKVAEDMAWEFLGGELFEYDIGLEHKYPCPTATEKNYWINGNRVAAVRSYRIGLGEHIGLRECRRIFMYHTEHGA